jgi:hypothetical protein
VAVFLFYQGTLNFDFVPDRAYYKINPVNSRCFLSSVTLLSAWVLWVSLTMMLPNAWQASCQLKDKSPTLMRATAHLPTYNLSSCEESYLSSKSYLSWQCKNEMIRERGWLPTATTSWLLTHSIITIRSLCHAQAICWWCKRWIMHEPAPLAVPAHRGGRHIHCTAVSIWEVNAYVILCKQRKSFHLWRWVGEEERPPRERAFTLTFFG